MSELSEAEVRLEKGFAVKQLLKQKTYYQNQSAEDASDYEKAVDEEIRTFLLGRLDELMGLKAGPKKAQVVTQTSRPATPAPAPIEVPEGTKVAANLIYSEAEGPLDPMGHAAGYTLLPERADDGSPEGARLFLKDGVKYVEAQNQSGGWYMKVVKHVTPPGAGYVPPPTGQMIGMTMQNRALNVVSIGQRRSPAHNPNMANPHLAQDYT